MSPTTNTGRDIPTSALPQNPHNMPPQTVQSRRSRPGNVQTSITPHSQLVAIPPASAVSTSSVASSSHCSPIMSPNMAGLTTGSSMVPSPEPLRGRDMEQFPAPNFQLPESILTRKTSANSLSQPLLNGQGAMHEVMGKGNLIRRLSNRAKAMGRRRTSSVQPNSRDGSVGPAILRRRSDSNNTAPPENLPQPFDTDSDEGDERDDVASMFDGAGPDVSPTSAPAPASAAYVSGAQAGPVIPLALLKGTGIRKVSKKNKGKRILLVLEPDSAKITWDRTRPWKSIYIDDIKEIRTGDDIRQYLLDFNIDPKAEENRFFFTILYTVPDRSQTKMMHLIADDEEAFGNWTMTLDAIYKHRQDSIASLMSFNDKAVRAYWAREMKKQFADKPHSVDDEEIDFAGVERVCRNLHIHVSSETLKSKFDEADATSTRRLDFAQFQEFVRLMKRREDIRGIYRRIASDPDSGLTSDEFLDFLRNEQGENVDQSLATWENVFLRFARRSKLKEADAKDSAEDVAPRMSEAALSSFLTSTYNVSIAKEPDAYELNRPINEYFISSSHNTYLLGRQVMGISSVEGYIAALMRGCRCVEIDCWDGNDGEPQVVHGKTWTSRISFREVINTINKYAFVKSQFPLWISLEVHCNPEQQRTMAKTMKDIFGAKLVTEPLPGAQDRFPTPSELKNRILIKAKKPQQVEPPKPVETNGRKRGNSLTSPYPKPVALDNSIIPPQYLPNSPLLSPNGSARKASSKTRVDTITEGEVHDAPSSSTSDNDSGSEKSSGRKKQSKIVPELGDLGVYCVGIKFNGFDDPESKTFNHVLSFMENTFAKHGKPRESKRALFRHNMRHLMRVYPNQTRITSTNFNPLAYWKKGVQMAALNWQTFDLGMQINQAMFAGGVDQSGYVLKPREFREIQVLPNLPGHWEGKRERKNVNFTVDVISAQQLMRPLHFGEKRSLDPYVEVEVFIPDDKNDSDETSSHTGQNQTKFRTQIVRENGFNPIFQRNFVFNITTKYPDLIFVRWSVKLAENGAYSINTLGTYTAKLSSLKQGYRTIPLLDNNADQYLFSTLFCRIKVNSATSIYVDYSEEAPENTNKLRTIGRTVFNRSANMSPKTSLDGAQSF
ncbi:uncharacterized protein E0L32_011151 [Thyridium curvatum]|uniref:Phosphoinositide phospholipase C n=1 Tax=Thyridium curvatum TaxID=1093900 RepID=A0A507AJE2_9PEZI|nr:uncharacterized protein E0L32_011151 [Thyridium curvatum]TPX06927.1 hypothetical protein E0L32_011151 [Thyridium curvatum]